jgi:hypothetical protein
MRAVRHPAVTWVLPLVALALAAAPAQAQFGRLRRAVERLQGGPSTEIRALLARIDTTRTLFDRATALLLKSTYVMEASVATEERRAAIRRELAAVDSLEKRGGDDRIQFDAQDRAVMLEQATAQRQFEGRKLSEEQQRNVANAGYNSVLAVLMDRYALDEAEHILGESQQAALNIAGDPLQLVYYNRLRDAFTRDLPAIVKAVPQQIQLASAINNSIQQVRSANQAVQVTEATARTDPPRPIDINAI